MGILEDLNRGVGNFARDVGDGVTDLGRSAQQSVDQALRNTAALAGSGVNSAGKITGPIADMFGSDPHAFVLNVAKKMRSQCRTLCLRVADRTGKADYVVQTPQGKRKITARPPSGANANQIALTLALACIDAPATANEEAGRMSRGLPAKPRGLESAGFSVFPTALPSFSGEGAQERGFLEGIPLPTPTDLLALLPILIPIIATIAVAVLPGLISAAAGVLASVTGGGSADKAKQEEAAQAAKAKEDESNTIMFVVIGAIVLLLGGGVVYALSHKRKAA